MSFLFLQGVVSVVHSYRLYTKGTIRGFGTCRHSVQDLTGRGLFTLLARPVLFSNTKTDIFDDMFEFRAESCSRLTLLSAMM